MKRIILSILLCSQIVISQENTTKKKTIFGQIKDHLYGSFESNSQWYFDDKTLGITEEKDRLRANSYLNLNYQFSNRFTAGIQVESYEPTHLKNYDDVYKKTNISNYYINYKSDKIDITVGHFYEQFGNGLILRTYEERQLGLNNALRGIKATYQPFSFVQLTTLCGRSRYGFKTSKSDIFGFDSHMDLAEVLALNQLNGLTLGFSYVGRNQSIEKIEEIKKTENFPELVNAFSFRSSVDFGSLYANFEYVTKGKDVLFEPRKSSKQKIIEGTFFKGNALIFTTGYTKKGMGISGTFRRLENMSFFSERNFANVSENKYGMLSVNYIPSLVKQHSYSLANIYIYQAQPNLTIADFDGRAGEIGGQIDLFYTFKKGSKIGGKYGTKLSANYSYWSLLKATFSEKNNTYSTSFLGFGKKLNNNFSLEIYKKWSKKMNSKILYVSSIIDEGIVYGKPLGFEYINHHLLAGETTYVFKNRKSLKIELQHLWTRNDKKNWLAGTIEFNINRNWSVYANDMFNYGNSDKNEQIHYYNFGGSYTKGVTRIALNYGRQRGGLICTGGVCRYVSPNNGFTLNVNTTF